MFVGQELIEIAIRIEKNGEAIYRGAAKETPHVIIKPMLEWLADDEAKHAEAFAKMGEDLDPEHIPAEEMDANVVQSVIQDRGFSLEDVDLTSISELRELLTTAIEFERDTVLFYELLRAFLDKESSKAVLDKIIADEERHVSQLSEFIESSKATV